MEAILKYQKLYTPKLAQEQRGEVRGDIRLLTAKQTMVHLLDCDGLTPTQISERTGLSLSRVANIKTRLKQLGFNPLKFRRRPEEMPAKTETDWSEVVAETGGLQVGTDEDELPDEDEPAFTDLERCHCGLIKPCYHANQSADRNP